MQVKHCRKPVVDNHDYSGKPLNYDICKCEKVKKTPPPPKPIK